jgi:predicted GNAT superfamily acetyltransferase
MTEFEKIITRKGRRFLLRVETSTDSRDYEKYESLRQEIWGFPEDNLPGSRNLMCENFLHDGGALFIGVFSESPNGVLAATPECFVGFSYGFVGVKDKRIAFRSPKNLCFYSQYTAVKAELQSCGLGVAIKEFQKQQVLNLLGISTITCTYDPLTGVNAWRNIHYFGMEVEEYRISTYGEFGGLLNRLDVPSDRFFLSWDLRAEKMRGISSRHSPPPERQSVLPVECRQIQGRNGSLMLEVVDAADLDKDEETLFVRIPLDFYQMLRETDVEDRAVREIPLRWRLETRAFFESAFKRRYEVMDFYQTDDKPPKNFYVLRRSK